MTAWRAERARLPAQAFIPLRFDPGEAYQFDWSHEAIELHRLPVASAYSRMRRIWVPSPASSRIRRGNDDLPDHA